MLVNSQILADKCRHNHVRLTFLVSIVLLFIGYIWTTQVFQLLAYNFKGQAASLMLCDRAKKK